MNNQIETKISEINFLENKLLMLQELEEIKTKELLKIFTELKNTKKQLNDLETELTIIERYS